MADQPDVAYHLAFYRACLKHEQARPEQWAASAAQVGFLCFHQHSFRRQAKGSFPLFPRLQICDRHVNRAATEPVRLPWILAKRVGLQF